jgi:hypothetical protein
MNCAFFLNVVKIYTNFVREKKPTIIFIITVKKTYHNEIESENSIKTAVKTNKILHVNPTTIPYHEGPSQYMFICRSRSRFYIYLFTDQYFKTLLVWIQLLMKFYDNFPT